MKYAFAFCVCVLFYAQPLFAQTSAQDSARIDEIARRDARHFKLARKNRKHLWRKYNNPNSDYFKPVNQYASDSSLLKTPFTPNRTAFMRHRGFVIGEQSKRF